MNKITIVNYEMGNLYSICNALEYLGAEIEVTNNVDKVMKADKLLLPGVGNFKKGMQNINDLNLVSAIKEKVLNQNTPILGICLGMQLLGDLSDEGGNTKGLSFIPGQIKLMKSYSNNTRVPHYGWTNLKNINTKSVLLKEIEDEMDFYFVHSYQFITDNNYISSTYDYGQPVVASIENEHIFGAQFHPEKSRKQGLKILSNFLEFNHGQK